MQSQRLQRDYNLPIVLKKQARCPADAHDAAGAHSFVTAAVASVLALLDDTVGDVGSFLEVPVFLDLFFGFSLSGWKYFRYMIYPRPPKPITTNGKRNTIVMNMRFISDEFFTLGSSHWVFWERALK